MSSDYFKNTTYTTHSGIKISRNTRTIDYEEAITPIINQLDHHRGVLLASSFDYPGRYTRWDIGFVNPPLQITAKQRFFSIDALNDRGKLLLPAIAKALLQLSAIIHDFKVDIDKINGEIIETEQHFVEGLRSKQPSVFSILRAIISLFYSCEDAYLGLYGAFGYDLAFQFEPIRFKLERNPDQRDLVLYLPDEIYIVDHQQKNAHINQYDFTLDSQSTTGLPRMGAANAYHPAQHVDRTCDHEPLEYAQCVRAAKEFFKRGDLFETVPGQLFYQPCPDSPAEVFLRLRERNPSPYGFLINLGEQEYLVGASPEMYVRVTGQRVETCPISGTIARGENAIGDAAQILKLLSSPKEAAELTMCTDVDRNDKSRVCQPGSVHVIGRRQIEMYSRLIHTVDHVEGILREGYDGIDAFLTHAWAATVTGAPKMWAMQFIEDHEHTPRRWYGGAIGCIGFNGNMNTGLTLRTTRIKNGVAEVRVGATLLHDSIPEAEEQETRLKASALMDAIQKPRAQTIPKTSMISSIGKNKHILLVDHQDSFVHTLANYLEQTGAKVTTLRSGFSEQQLCEQLPDLIVLSPGPGRPSDFNVSRTIKMAIDNNIPIFGVCLGLQGLVEYFGGELTILDYPMHGKPSQINVFGGKLFSNLPKSFIVGRYHSLYAKKETLPSMLTITAESDDGIIMAIEHQSLPISAVQFHPESILTLEGNIGLKIIQNLIRFL